MTFDVGQALEEMYPEEYGRFVEEERLYKMEYFYILFKLILLCVIYFILYELMSTNVIIFGVFHILYYWCS